MCASVFVACVVSFISGDYVRTFIHIFVSRYPAMLQQITNQDCVGLSGLITASHHLTCVDRVCERARACAALSVVCARLWETSWHLGLLDRTHII